MDPQYSLAILHHSIDFSTLLSITVYSIFIFLAYTEQLKLLLIPPKKLALFPQLPSLSLKNCQHYSYVQRIQFHLICLISYHTSLTPSHPSSAQVPAILTTFLLTVCIHDHSWYQVLRLRLGTASVCSAPVQVAGHPEHAPGASLFIVHLFFGIKCP